MGKLTLVALLLAACGSNGGSSGDDDDMPPARCGDGIVDSNEQCDDGNSIAGDGCTLCMIDGQRTAKIDASWSLVTAENPTVQTDCPSGFDTAVLTATPPTGSPTIDMFDCADKMGMSTALALDSYTATLAITDAAMSQTFGTSIAQTIDLSDGTDKTMPTAQFITDGGVIKVAWKLVKMSDNSPVTCDAVSAMAHIGISGAPDGNMSMATTTGALCSAGMTVTDPFVAASYTITLSVKNDTFSTVGTATPLTGQVLTAPNGVLDLGTVTIPVSTL
ncbi:MAG: DUF4215 domain-containing protein [Kofleriaceae bacterium]